MYRIVDGPIDEMALDAAVRTDADGAVIVFRGVARRYSRGRDVVHLEYEAYPEMAEKVMAQIGEEMKARWPITGVAIVHRTGVLEIGQASVAIAVSAPHRGEAFEATRYAIDRLKQIVPIWKKEIWSDGSQWIGWEHAAHAHDESAALGSVPHTESAAGPAPWTEAERGPAPCSEAERGPAPCSEAERGPAPCSEAERG
jgi:molybdopterin synthase catalytic subunit